VHRIGRTARAGEEGHALSLVCVDELKLLRDIEKVLGNKLEQVIVPGYEIDPTIKAEPINKGRGQRSGNQSNGARQQHKGPPNGRRRAGGHKAKRAQSNSRGR
jgi:ATP-dependent RNA helicase RhlE